MSVVELRFYAWNDPNGTLLGTLTDRDVKDFIIRPEFRGAEAGGFSIPRSHPSASTTLLGFGISSLAGPRLVKVHFPWMPAPYDEDPVFAFWLWEGDFKLLDQNGDDLLSFSGPGVRGIWSDYVLYHSSTVSDQPFRGSADVPNVWWWENQPYGAIATRLFEEGRHNPYPGAAAANSTFQHVTIDFDRVTDSAAQTWSVIAEEYQFRIRTDAGTVLADLEEAGDFTLVGRPDLSFSAYESWGTDRTGTAYGAGVVRVQGDTGTQADNLLTSIKRHAFLNRQRTHILGEDMDGAYHTEIHPSYSSGPERWGSMESPETNDDDLLNRKAAQAFVNQDRDQNQIEVEIKPGNDEANGRYLPFVHFIPGDTITVDTGSTSTDYNNVDALLSGFRVQLAEAADDSTADNAARSLHVTLDLNTRSVSGVPLNSPNAGSSGTGHTHPPNLCIPGTPSESNDSEIICWDWESGDETVPAIPSLSQPSGTVTRSFDALDSWYALLDNTGSASTFPRGADGLAFAAPAAGTEIRFEWVSRVGSTTSRFGVEWLTGDYDDWSAASINDFIDSEELLKQWNNGGSSGPPLSHSVTTTVPAGGITAFRVNSNGGGFTTTWRCHSLCITALDTTEAVPRDGHPDLVGTSNRAARCDHSHTFYAERAPSVTDDFSEGFIHLGIRWVNTATGEEWRLDDTTDDAAVWTLVAPSGGVGISGDFVEKADGGNEFVNVVAATGTTETIDLSTGNHQDFTLDDDCTFTMPTVGEGKSFTAFVRQDGTGGHTPTFTDVEWPDDTPPTWSTDPDAVDIVTFVSDGVVWYGSTSGSGGSSVGALDDLSDVTITTPAANDQLQYIGGEWVNNARRWEPVVTDPGGGPELVFDGTGDIVMTWADYG